MLRFISIFTLITITFGQRSPIQSVVQSTISGGSFRVDILFQYSQARVVDKDVTHRIIVKQDDKQIYSDDKKIGTISTGADTLNSIFDRFVLSVGSGTYSFQVQVVQGDEVIIQSDPIQKRLDVPKSGFFTSDLYVFNEFKKNSGQPSIFTFFNQYDGKVNFDGHYVIGQNNAMFWYFEIYELPQTDSLLTITTEFRNSSNRVVKTVQKSVKYTGNAIAWNNVYNVVLKFSDGSYSMRNVLKTASGASYTMPDYYFVVKKEFAVKKDLSQSDGRRDMIELEADEAIIKHQIDGNQRKIFQSMDDEAKTRYIMAFYSTYANKRNTTFARVIKYFRELDRLIKERWGAKFGDGYRNSHPAYLIFKYGVPSNIELINDDRNLKPHQIWTYENLYNGVKFYLADLNNFGLQIIHTTHPTEGFRNPGWKRRLAKAVTYE